MGLSRLAQKMANDAALSSLALNPNQPNVLSPTPASRDNPGVMPDWAEALLIMAGCKAKYVINYWRVENKYGAVAHISRFNDIAEWQSVLKALVEKRN